MLETQSLDDLKKLILVKTGLTLISPSDCKSISLSIQKELNKNISETTLKRLFGFASVTTKFSQFTMNTLTEFVSSSMEQKGKNGAAVNTSVEKIIANAKQITNCNLQNIKSRCSVPYELTIARKFANHDFHYFYDSEYSFTAFIAQPGYGKTILLSHLVQDLVANEDGKHTHDIICYFTASNLFDPDLPQISLEESMKSKLGLSAETNLIEYSEKYYQESNGKLIVILDGFSELVLNRYSKIKIFDHIVNFIATVNESNAIKLILSMRSTIWNRFFERVRHAHFLKRKWFPGSYYYLDYNSNVPPLSEKELELVFEKINPGKFKKLSPNLKSQLKFPFHIQWYYRLKEQYPIFSSYTNITFYEIIDLFIKEKIYGSNYATEKLFFCRQVIKLTNFSKKGDSIAKSDLMQDIAVYKNAYMELLADGILMEDRRFQNNFAVEYVRFVHPHIFEYFLFTELLALHHQNIDKHFFKHIQHEYVGNQVRFQLLQWSVRELIISSNFEGVVNLFILELTSYEKNYLIYFIAENLTYRSLDHPEVKHQIKEQNLHKVLIQELIHFDFIDSCYSDAIDCLLETVDTPENAYIYHCILGIIECLSLDLTKISNRLDKLQGLKLVQSHSLINAYEVIHLIYDYLNRIQVAPDNQTLVRVEAIKKNEIMLNPNLLAVPGIEDSIDYILIMFLSAFYGTPNDVITFVNLIFKSYPNLVNNKSSFSLYLLNVLAISSIRVNHEKKIDQMERVISKLYESKNRKKPTLYSQSLLLMLKAHQSKHRKDYDSAISYTKEAIAIFKRNDTFIYELSMYNLIIAIYVEMHNMDKANHYTYKKLVRLEAKNIPRFSLDFIN